MNRFPPLWANSAEASAWWQHLKPGSRSVLLLDYDGTLAPFHLDRFKAKPYPGVEDRLAVLAHLPRVRLALVSGRSARELRGLLRPGIRLEIWGSHGWERLDADGAYQLFPMAPAHKAMLCEVESEMIRRGLAETLEVKPSSLAIHWRQFDLPGQEKVRSTVESIFARLGDAGNLHLLPFDGGVELRSSDRTKGHAVRGVQKEEPGVPMAYLGDDLTDEDAFAAIGDCGLSLLVRSEVRASCASYWLRPPEDLLDFLDCWIDAAEGR
jgi:trehalose-phosphatase